ncbi:helix-turn-helix domain-containing protein [Stakelama sp. CBK3Z-3]|uniref:Helix-turn-helix domain-containing protein n=1 Tax=Stakelama flava TaxID=2860338 RepID=A0ABS6XJW4_9SPHN|nr:helix-turn-helix domain-containing protein [Stakelama flava]MBW4330475.1 helix-turn-helix domain-containing protein [Stakelama flava]
MAMIDPWRELRGNHLLASLNAHDARLIASRLKRTRWDGGERIDHDDPRFDYACFPETLVACMAVASQGRESGFLGMVGNEGMFGWQLPGAARSSKQYITIVAPGTALTISGRDLQSLCNAAPTLAQSLFRYVDMFLDQLQRTMLSHFCDPPSARLARWLLLLHDRIEGDDIEITHDQLASALHVRRATITDCLHIIEGELALECNRGRIRVRNRQLLEKHASNGYGDAERADCAPAMHLDA